MRYYKIKDYANVAGNYVGTLAMATGAFMLGNNWTLAIGAGLSVPVIAAGVKISSMMYENHLQEHPASHIHSPNLKKMVDKLYKISGLKVENNPVYDFRAKKNDKDSALGSIAAVVMENAALMPNAAASNITKPVIIISEPLLELLTDEEEYAVLAHEFVHAGARHQWVTMPKTVVSSMAAISNSLVSAWEFFSSGVVGVVAGILAGSSVSSALKPKGREALLSSDKNFTDIALEKAVDLGSHFTSMTGMRQLNQKLSKLSEEQKRETKATTPEELVARKKAKFIQKTAGQLTSVGVVSAFNPVYLPVYAAVRGMNTGLMLSNKKLSRIFEFHADRMAVQKFGADPLALTTALRKISSLLERSQRNANGFAASDVKQSALATAWAQAKTTHPSVTKRGAALSELARQMGADENAIDKAVNGEVDIDDAPDLPLDLAEAIAMQFHIENSLI